MSHILFFNLFNCDLRSGFYVNRHFDQTELSVSESLLKLVKVKDIAVPHNVLKSLSPNFVLLLRIKVKYIHLIWRYK
jgi:hypothetical protein